MRGNWVTATVRKIEIGCRAGSVPSPGFFLFILTGTIPWETTNGHEKARIITELDAVEAFLFQALNGELYGTAIRHRSSFVSLRVHSWFNCMVPV